MLHRLRLCAAFSAVHLNVRLCAAFAATGLQCEIACRIFSRGAYSVIFCAECDAACLRVRDLCIIYFKDCVPHLLQQVYHVKLCATVCSSKFLFTVLYFDLK
jgi:hypothetical protein